MTKLNKIKMMLGWVFLWLPPAIIFYMTKPFCWLHDLMVDLCNKADNYLMTIYTPQEDINEKLNLIINNKFKNNYNKIIEHKK